MSQASMTLCLLLLLPVKALADEAASPREITFDTLKFEIKKGAAFERKMLTPEIEKLAGQKVRIRGYMLPGGQATGISEFVLIHDNMLNNVWQFPLHDAVIVKIEAGQTSDFTNNPIALEGVLRIREEKYLDGTTFAIYHLDAQKIVTRNVKLKGPLEPIFAGAGK